MNDKLIILTEIWDEAITAMILLSPPLVMGALASIVMAKLFSTYLNRSIWPIAALFFMFSLFGTTIGVFMGASKQPIVASTLPPIITLVSGYIVLTKGADMSPRTRLTLPGALLMLLLMLLFGAFYMKCYTSVTSVEERVGGK